MTSEERQARIHYHMYTTNEGIAEHAERIVALEELVSDMFGEIEGAGFDPLVERQGKRGPYYEEDPSWRDGIRKRVRELGVEVDE